MLKICSVHENFDSIHITTLGLILGLNVNFVSDLLVEVVEGLFVLETTIFAALDQFYLLNNV